MSDISVNIDQLARKAQNKILRNQALTLNRSMEERRILATSRATFPIPTMATVSQSKSGMG